tara:strand:+ start:52 stop:1929 length:1878 start_codon:yes stop_codon:yes gene_type:complete
MAKPSRAQQTVTVNFQAKGERQLTNAIMLLDKASKSLTMTQTALIKNSKHLENQQRRQAKSTRILGGTFAVLRSKMLLFNFAMALGIRQAIQFGKQASQVESMGRAFNSLAGTTENSQEALEKLKIATNDTMSEFDLFQQANNAMVLGVSKNSDEMAEMFDIAQRLGRALGRDTASSVESLVTGIGRQSRLMLDNIGIIVKADKAYESYAKKLGINVEQLTDAEKKQAFLNATMESARAKVKTLGDETLTSQDVYDKLTTATTNLGTQTGEFLQPLLIGTSKMFTDLATSASSYLNSINIADRAVEKNMSTEEKRTILKARLEKIQTALNRAELLSSSNEFGYKSGQDEKQLIMKRRIEKIKKILLNLDKEEEELKKVKNETDIKSNEIADYRAEISQQELDILKQKNEAMIGGISIVEQLALIEEQRELNRLKSLNGDITEQEFKKKNLELAGKEITLEEKLGQVKLQTVSNTIGALSELAKSSQATFELGKALALAQSIIDTYGAGNKVLNSKLPYPTNVIAMAGVIATGLNNVSKIRSQKFEQGGLVGGQRHSQGGTMIEAERGEFVMSRNAVDSIGINNLEQMNQGSGGGITLNISAPLVDETVIDTIIPAIEKAQRMNLA